MSSQAKYQQVADRIRQAIRKGEYLPGSHAIYWQKPEECGKLVKDFLDGIKASDKGN